MVTTDIKWEGISAWIIEVIWFITYDHGKKYYQGQILLTWADFNPKMDKQSHAQ